VTLIPVHHAIRLRSPAEAEALLRALGDRQISARGFNTTDPGRLGRVVAAVTPSRDSTVSFEGGRLNAGACAALSALVSSGAFQYLDLRTIDANLRVWPGRHAWVHTAMPAGGLEGLSAVFGATVQAGENWIAGGKLVVKANGGYPVDLETENLGEAFAAFDALTSARVERGFVTALAAAGKPAFLQLLLALGTTASAVLELELGDARALTEVFPGERLEWHGAVIVRFPEGEVFSYLVTPKAGDEDREKWSRRVDKGLKKAGLG
jgi:hypothetical protein